MRVRMSSAKHRRRRTRRSTVHWARTAVLVASIGVVGGGFVTSAAAAVPGAPTGLSATVSGTSVILTWTNATGALGANVYRDTSTKFWAGGYPNPTPTTYTNTSVPAGTHTYAVADYNSSGLGARSATISVTVGGTPPPAPTVTGLLPSSGSSVGGTSVTVSGTNFTGATAVAFGPTPATGFSVTNATTITATSPAGSGTVDVTVTTGGGTSATGAADQFTYTTAPPPLPTVTLVNPNSGPSGTSVNITGTDLTGASAVDFGATPATGYTVNSATTVTATVPAGTGTVDVTVTTPGGTSLTSANDQFTYSAGPPPGAVPSPVAGGWKLNGSATLVTTATPPNLQLTAAKTNQAGSAFWPTPVPGVGISAAFDASIGGGTGADGLTFTLADASVTAPSALGVAGGGEGFSGITGIAVSLDTYKNSVNPSNNFVGIATGPGPTSDTLHYVTTNSSIASLRGTVHHFVVTTFSTGLSVTMDGSQVLTYATALPTSVLVGFTGGTGGSTDIHAVQNVSITAGPPPPVPTVTAVSPASGPSTGGTSVTITGTALTGASAVDFGGMAAASFAVDSDTSITATTAPTATGTVDVTVSTPGGTSAPNAPDDQFTFTPPPAPTVTLVNPASAPAGTSVTITGSDLTGASAVDFGPANPAATFSVTSATSMTATAPNGTGTVDVTVTTPGGTSTTSTADQFTYTLPPTPTVTGINPTSGPNGTSVTITGTDLTGTTGVAFGTTAATTFAVSSATSVTATSPGGTGTVDVTVTTAGGTSAVNAGDQYTYTAGPPPPPTLVTTYRGDLGRSGYYPAETGLTTANAATLKLHWTDSASGGSFGQPIIAGNMVFWGDWKGLVHGTALTGKDTWTVNVGTDTPPSTDKCSPASAGPTGTPTVGMMGTTLVLYVPGGDDNFYALNAQTGALIWKTSVAPQPNNFLWGSPTLVDGSIYQGVASFGDCPLVQGKLVQLDASAGTLQHTFTTVPSNCPGGGVWGSPTVDTADGSIYIVTGNPSCTGTTDIAPAIIKLNASDLSLVSSWKVPTSAQSAGDADFGSTPVLFTATINGQARSLVGAVNKNAIFYAFDRTDLAAGPVWQSTVGTASGDPAVGSIVSAAWDGTNLYVGGGGVTINGTKCTGNIDALNPATGAFVWRSCQSSHMFAGITAVPGVIVEGTLGNAVVFLNAATGSTLFTYKTASQVQGEASVSNGVVYIPVANGSLVALGQ